MRWNSLMVAGLAAAPAAVGLSADGGQLLKRPTSSVHQFEPGSQLLIELITTTSTTPAFNGQSLVSNNRTSPTRRPNDVRQSSIESSIAGWFPMRDDRWSVPVLVLSAINMVTIFLFEVFVLYKACRTSPSRRHLFLGQMLLLGLFLSSALGVAFAVRPNWWTCSVIRAGLGVCYSLVLATLLVKTVFLISLHSGIYLPAEYQALLLFFVVITQVAIDTQWLANESTAVVMDLASPTCSYSTSSLLMSLTYDVFLMLIVAFLALKAKGHRENHGEALFIGITIICSAVLWCVWTVGAASADRRGSADAFTAFGIVGNATIAFLAMFLPKGRQLAAMGRSNKQPDFDDDDRYSRASSGFCTPSFLHFKPSLGLPWPLATGKNLYKHLEGTNGSSGYFGSAKSGSNECFYYLPKPPQQPPPPPPKVPQLTTGHRVWRTGCYPNGLYQQPTKPLPQLPPSAAQRRPPDDGFIFPFSDHHQRQALHLNSNVKFFRGPCY